jgi:Co/Zn/Cd efflux system component
MDHPLTAQIREAIESDADARVADLHVWRVGRKHHAAVVCVVAAEPLSPAGYRARLAGYTSLVHVSVEVNRSPGAADTPA